MLTQKTIPSIKRDILGEKYSLSVAFVSAKKSREINKKYRGVDKPTNVLSFALRPGEGELLLCKKIIESEAKKKGVTLENWFLTLVIHGLLHLKGFGHSSRMERAENFYRRKYDQKYFSGHRRGLRHYPSSGRRIRKGRKKS
jgi:probable rRNA maturation factor